MIRAAFACLAATVVVAGLWTPPAWAIEIGRAHV